MRALTVLLITLGIGAGFAAAEDVNFNFPIAGDQVVPPVDTPGSGLGDVTLNTDSLELSWNITFSDLTGSVSAAHFHGPADFGQNAGFIVNIGDISGLASPMIGNATLSQTQADDLLAGLWYVNIHTSTYPAGEIRGQVVPEPSALMLTALAVPFILRRR